MKTIGQYKDEALAMLGGKWTKPVLLSLIVALISVAPALVTKSDSGSFINVAVSIVVMCPLSVGIYASYRRFYLGQGVDMVNSPFQIGFSNWGHHVSGMLLMGVYTFLWSLLLIVPGIIKGLSYAMTPFILEDKSQLSANEAIELSMKMMEGRKMDLFLLGLSFIGWGILCLLTLGIGYLWLTPYIYVSMASFYEDVKADYQAKMVP